MQTLPAPYSKTLRRGPAPVSHAIGVEVTDQDILDGIAHIASQQSTCYVSIAKLALALGFGTAPEDRDWLIGTLKVLDTEGSIVLSPVEHPHNLPLPLAMWYVRNASGIPCHEVALSTEPQPSRRIAPLLRRQAPELPIFARAKDTSSDNPRVQQRRISDLVERSAETLFACGATPHALFRVLHVEQDQHGEAA